MTNGVVRSPFGAAPPSLFNIVCCFGCLTPTLVDPSSGGVRHLGAPAAARNGFGRAFVHLAAGAAILHARIPAVRVVGRAAAFPR